MNSTLQEDHLAVRNTGRSYTIFAAGFAKWWGSDARALAQTFRRLGHSILDIDEEDFVPWRWQGVVPRVLRRIFGRVWLEDYNQAVLAQAASSSYDFVLVFKGKLLKPETVRRLGALGKPVFNIYPDVSFQDHGPYIPEALQYYDCVFTTKSYHGERERQMFRIRNLEHVRHGFDPDVHRPIAVSLATAKYYACDVSFVGCWSPEKEVQILYLLKRNNNLNLKVYGIGWKYASSEFKQRMGNNLRPGAFGDELSIVYSSSKVNLGLLSCAVSEPSLRDQTTARTFQIPAANAFLIHEDTPEVRSLFKEGEEILLFNSDEDLVDKVNYALQEQSLREAICARGHTRCLQEPYDYSSAAQRILRYYEHQAKS